ncbi:hypothetical protein ACLOJK_025880 [Asimina triloba]
MFEGEKVGLCNTGEGEFEREKSESQKCRRFRIKACLRLRLWERNGEREENGDDANGEAVMQLLLARLEAEKKL